MNYTTIRPLLFSLTPEAAHNLSLVALKSGMAGCRKNFSTPILAQNLFDSHWPSAIGMAPGYDKNAEVIAPLLNQGFGFVEAGTVTPRPQKGNPKPRLFRLKEDQAVINRMGFNNKGIRHYIKGLRKAFELREQGKIHGRIGANIGRNKDSENDASDYQYCMEAVFRFCDYITVNISSPNTPGLRDIHEKDVLKAFLEPLLQTHKELQNTHQLHRPVFLKLSPDVQPEKFKEALDVIVQTNVEGLAISNTTLSRDGLISKHKDQAGGMSGKPLHSKSVEAIKLAYSHLGGELPIIGIGGIHNAQSAYETIKAGASLIQIYSAFVYSGFGLIKEIEDGLLELLAADGHEHISDAVGANSQ